MKYECVNVSYLISYKYTKEERKCMRRWEKSKMGVTIFKGRMWLFSAIGALVDVDVDAELLGFKAF